MPITIREARTAKGWTQLDLALVSGVSHTWIAALEGGTAALSDAIAGKMAAALKVDEDDLRAGQALTIQKRKAAALAR